MRDSTRVAASPNSYLEEGVDHINISSRSSTFIGKLLDPSYGKSFEYPHIGRFNSVLSLWYWLRKRPLNDNLRRGSGTNLRNKIAEKTKGHDNVFVPNFLSIIGYATWLKLQSYPHAIEEIRNLPPTVDLISYYVPRASCVRICSSYASGIIPIVQVIREAINRGVEPDFSVTATHPELRDLHWLEGFLTDIHGAAAVKKMKSQQ